MEKRKEYQKMTISRIEVWCGSPILAGSVTGETIVTEQVTVKGFEDDPSFPTDGFEVSFD